LTCDVGSLPFSGDFESFSKGAHGFGSLLELLHPEDPSKSGPCHLFEEKVLEGLLGKLHAGIDVPNYPQFRDMNEMFLELMDGVRKTKGGYDLNGRLRLKPGRRVLPEVEAVKRNASRIRETVGQKVALKICVTGPYTLSSLLVNRTPQAFIQFGEVLQEIVEANVIKQSNLEVTLVSIDEPTFGFISDPLLDRGALGREILLETWERICHRVKARGAKTIMHLHNTADEIFWNVRALEVVESHVGDPLYESVSARKACETSDKFVKASIAVTDFDRLIREKILESDPNLSEASIGGLVAETWNSIKKGETDPEAYLESKRVMESRLKRILSVFGEERVPLAGPECGTRSFPTIHCALECLRRTSEATRLKT
jgi:5-methyltetrahydropteroyltriglutamate--homocysteine methyltransferase